ncbi:MAG: DUF3276 family protein [Candidatus Delongbacteria bacterium]|jgi:hypothetical protein|nr:DUF3276 family protein [Candidatus Delongbacteria bacterium]
MENQNQNEIFTTNFKAGQRMFFLNMCEAKNNSKYLKITESKTVQDGENETHGIMIFEQDFEKLTNALTEAMSKVDLKEVAKRESKKVNKDYPNAGMVWSEEDETKLTKLFKKGNSTEALMKVFGRSEKGITSRLEMLGLVEA